LALPVDIMPHLVPKFLCAHHRETTTPVHMIISSAPILRHILFAPALQAAVGGLSHAVSADKSNVIISPSDDYGYGSAGFCGAPANLLTPNLGRLPALNPAQIGSGTSRVMGTMEFASMIKKSVRIPLKGVVASSLPNDSTSSTRQGVRTQARQSPSGFRLFDVKFFPQQSGCFPSNLLHIDPLSGNQSTLLTNT